MNRYLIIILCVVITGCATSGNQIDQSKLSQIKEGITTKQEVEAILGIPEMVNLTSDGKEILMYQHFKYQTNVATFIPVVGLLAGGANTSQQILQVLIAKDGKVEKYTFNDSQSQINSGLLNTSK